MIFLFAKSKENLFLVLTETGLSFSHFWEVADDRRYSKNISSLSRVIVPSKSTEVDAEMVQLMIRSKS